MGGSMDGMGDLDAPMPPMGTEDGGMEDQMGNDPMGGEMPMDDQDPMGGEDQDTMNGGEDDELMNIINNLSIEDKAAVTKYAKSMVDDSEDGGMEDQMGNDPMGGDMPMESVRSIKNIIDETINDVLDDREGTKRPEKRMPKEYRGLNNPFKSPFK